jgi:hypothetical protein
MFSEELFLLGGSSGLNVGKMEKFEINLQKLFEEIRTFNEVGIIFDVKLCVVCYKFI